jgi:hypothetical protein
MSIVLPSISFAEEQSIIFVRARVNMDENSSSQCYLFKVEGREWV